jgi:hypothetical protein
VYRLKAEATRVSMRALSAYRDGLRRVNGALLLVAGMALATLLVALPLSFAVRDAIERHLGPSLAAEAVAEGASFEWWQEFGAQASGLAATFVPSIVGAGAVLDNLDALLEHAPWSPAILAVTVTWLVVWSFLSGGALDRLARRRPTRAHGFFAACGVHFWRFVRIGAVALAVYAFLFLYVHGWIFQDLYPYVTRDFTVERQAFAVRLGGYLLFGGLLAAATAVFDFARVRTVVEDRRSAVGAIVAGARFVRRHAGPVAALYVVHAAAVAVLVALYAALSPGAPGAGLGGGAVLALGQAYILGRHYLKLAFYGAEIALFQAALAHSSYTAAPAVVWPDSPAAESIANADRGVPVS